MTLLQDGNATAEAAAHAEANWAGSLDRLADDGRRRLTVWVGWIEFDLLLGDVHSLKGKRGVVRPLVAEVRRRFAVAAAETGTLDLHRRAGVGVSVVAADARHVRDVLDEVERFVAARPETELLSARRGLASSADDSAD